MPCYMLVHGVCFYRLVLVVCSIACPSVYLQLFLTNWLLSRKLSYRKAGLSLISIDLPLLYELLVASSQN